MRRWFTDDSGQALILIAAALGGLLLGIGLALDTGQLFVARRAAQTAADAGSWAGASVLYAGGNAAQAQTAAITDATRNGYTDNADIDITAVVPPASGPNAGDSGFIEVTITERVLTRFLFGASAGRTAVTVRSVAGTARSATGGEALIVTRATGAQTLAVNGNTDLIVTGGGTNVNTTNGNAVQIQGNGSVTATFNRVTGGVNSGDAGKMSPAPTVGVAAAPDPFAALGGPSTTSLPVFAGQSITSTVTLSSGVYTGLITVGSGGVARLNPGNYVFRAGLTTTGTGSLILNTTGGVMLYNANANYPAVGGACGNFSIAGTGAFNLSAGTSGTYAGMLVYQHRTCTNAAALTVRTVTTLSGTLYVPAATLTITVANNRTITSQIVADRLVLTGGSTLTMAFTPGLVAGARVPSLVE